MAMSGVLVSALLVAALLVNIGPGGESGASERRDLEFGEASWYGRAFEGRKTASGELFDADELTAAHPTLPLGTIALVTNLDNGAAVLVEITDRGPYVEGRVIDLSRAAANKIGMIEEGTSPVRIEVQGRARSKAD